MLVSCFDMIKMHFLSVKNNMWAIGVLCLVAEMVVDVLFILLQILYYDCGRSKYALC